MKLSGHGEVVHKTTSLQGFLNLGLTVKEGHVNNMDTTVVYMNLHLYCSGISKVCVRGIYMATFESNFLGEEFHTAFGWLVKQEST